MRKTHILLTLFAFGGAAIFVTADEKIDFGTQIYPFVKSGCVQCHAPEYVDERGRTRRPKAGIVFATKEGILSAEDHEEKKILVPGDSAASKMLQVTLLPLDHDDHQPPEGRAPQWTDAEKALFAKWIEQGAEFGDWTEDPAPLEGIEWDGTEKEPGTLETFD